MIGARWAEYSQWKMISDREVVVGELMLNRCSANFSLSLKFTAPLI